METFYTILLSVAGLAGAFLLFMVISRTKDKYLSSDLNHCLIWNDEVIIISHIFHSGGEGDAYRHTRIIGKQLSTGKLTCRLVIRARLGFQEQQGSVLIFRLPEHHIYAFDMHTKKAIFDQDILSSLDPGIKSEGISRVDFTDGKDFSITTLKGNKKSIPLSTLINTDFSNIHSGAKRKTDFSFDAGERRAIHYKGNRIGGDQTWLKALKIIENEEGCIFIHYDTLVTGSPFIITMVDTSGKEKWNLWNKDLQVSGWNGEDEKSEVKFADLKGDHLIICFDARRDVAVNINWRTGSVHWIYKI